MNDYFTAVFPFASHLTTVLSWCLFVNSLLIGAVILLAYRAAALAEKVKRLEEQAADRSSSESAPNLAPLEDDKPIPVAHHRFGDASPIIRDARSKE